MRNSAALIVNASIHSPDQWYPTQRNPWKYVSIPGEPQMPSLSQRSCVGASNAFYSSCPVLYYGSYTSTALQSIFEPAKISLSSILLKWQVFFLLCSGVPLSLRNPRVPSDWQFSETLPKHNRRILYQEQQYNIQELLHLLVGKGNNKYSLYWYIWYNYYML